MMGKPILGVDVDLCIYPSDKGWIDYLTYYNGFGEVTHREDGLLPYNLAEMFPHVTDAYLYWRDLDYSTFSPLTGSVEALEKLSESFNIVFISAELCGYHSKNKRSKLELDFPFLSGYAATKEKFIFKGSVVAHIDDRLDHLEKFDFDQRILFNTNYTQSVECDVPYSFSVWNDEVVSKLCESYL
jgi:5'(3')-deoxyribonucleotidase